MISGDNPVTVSEVARRAGIENAEKFISLEGLNEKETRRYILDKIEEFYKEQDAIDKAKHPLPERGAA